MAGHNHLLPVNVRPIRIRHGAPRFLLALCGILGPSGESALDLHGCGGFGASSGYNHSLGTVLLVVKDSENGNRFHAVRTQQESDPVIYNVSFRTRRLVDTLILWTVGEKAFVPWPQQILTISSETTLITT